MKFKAYLVGGALRDEFLNRKSKDLDFVVMAFSFEELTKAIEEDGGEIFVSKPEFGTIRAKHPRFGVADFALPRIDGKYTDGRRPDSVVFVDDIVSDLSRRDSTMNAMARDMDTGEIIDPFNGRRDINSRVVCAVGDAEKRIEEDKLRAFRYVRQAFQLGFFVHYNAREAINNLIENDFIGVSTERILEEARKMFSSSNFCLSLFISQYAVLWAVMQRRGIWLKPTLEKI